MQEEATRTRGGRPPGQRGSHSGSSLSRGLPRQVLKRYTSCNANLLNKSNLILLARAKAFHAAGRLDPALRDLTEAVRVAPQNRELHKILLSLKLEMKDKARVRDDAKDSRDSSSGVCSSGEGSTRDEDHDNETSL